VSDLGLVGMSSRTCMVRSVCECPGWLKCLPTLVLPCVWYESGAEFQLEACSMSLRLMFFVHQIHASMQLQTIHVVLPYNPKLLNALVNFFHELCCLKMFLMNEKNERGNL